LKEKKIDKNGILNCFEVKPIDQELPLKAKIYTDQNWLL